MPIFELIFSKKILDGWTASVTLVMLLLLVAHIVDWKYFWIQAHSIFCCKSIDKFIKNYLGENITNLANERKRSLLFSLEMPKEEIFQNIWKKVSHFELSKVKENASFVCFFKHSLRLDIVLHILIHKIFNFQLGIARHPTQSNDKPCASVFITIWYMPHSHIFQNLIIVKQRLEFLDFDPHWHIWEVQSIYLEAIKTQEALLLVILEAIMNNFATFFNH